MRGVTKNTGESADRDREWASHVPKDRTLTHRQRELGAVYVIEMREPHRRLTGSDCARRIVVAEALLGVQSLG
jgi:hypothetical protein